MEVMQDPKRIGTTTIAACQRFDSAPDRMSLSRQWADYKPVRGGLTTSDLMLKNALFNGV